MAEKIYYKSGNGREIETDFTEMPKKCGDCVYCLTGEEYSHYDDLDGFDVYYAKISCTASKKLISEFRKEGSLGYDYGCEERALGKRADSCPLYAR